MSRRSNYSSFQKKTNYKSKAYVRPGQSYEQKEIAMTNVDKGQLPHLIYRAEQKLLLLNNTEEKAVTKITAEISKVSTNWTDDDDASFFDANSGICQMPMKALYSAPALHDQELVSNYYSNIARRNMHSSVGLPIPVRDVGYKALGLDDTRIHFFISSLGLIPNKNMHQDDKAMFNSTHKFASIAHEPFKFEIFRKAVCPIFGYAMETPEMNKVVELYRNNIIAQEYVQDAMIAISAAAGQEREDNNRETIHHDQMRPPKKELPKFEAPTHIYTSHTVISSYVTTIGLVFEYENPRLMNDGAEVSSIKASVQIKTITVRPLSASATETGGNLQGNFEFAKSEVALSQTVDYTATYIGKNIPLRGYDLKLVTANAGAGKKSSNDIFSARWQTELGMGKQGMRKTEWQEHIGMMAYEFGNGVPTQHIILGDRNFLSIHAMTSLPAEIPSTSCMKLLRSAPRISNDPTRKGWGDLAFENPDAESIVQSEKLNNPRQDASYATQSNDLLDAQKIDVSPRMGLMCFGRPDNLTSWEVEIRARMAFVFVSVGIAIVNLTDKSLWIPPRQPKPLLSYLQTDARIDDMRSCMSVGSCELDIGEIMSMAARPSAFDEEVYM